jgi:predicted KAP-like P-loop ATPase
MFKNLHILDENYRIDDYFDLDVTVDQYESKINDIKSSASIAIVAPFGYGKTTFLNQLKKRLNKNSWRIDFDAWKYPNREDLWEAFVLETVKQIN